LGLTQKQLGELLGVSNQQVHKYEAGMNRVTVGRLFQVAQVFHVNVAYFYQDVHQDTGGMTKQHRLILELTRNFTAIPSSRHRQALAALARFMASNGDGV
jgi:transcriptional regulator with XRE-family HTH domain